SVLHVLDHPELRKVFSKYDEPANSAKKRSRLLGFIAIAFGVVALLGASAAPLYHGGPWAVVIGSVSALAGILSVLIGWWGLLFSEKKREWLHNRLMTERLRQFHFQTIPCRFNDIITSLKNQDTYKRLCEQWLETIKQRFEGHLNARYTSVTSNTIDDSEVWLHECQSSNLAQENATKDELKQLLDAYRELRINHQLQYANYKLRQGSTVFTDASKKQGLIFKNTSLVLIVVVFAIHMVIAFMTAFGISEVLGEVGMKILHVAAIWVAITALASRALEEGLQPDREIERYEDYRLGVQSILNRYEAAQSLSEKISIMQEMERLSYDEMQNFLRTHDKARFVM
ncbi:MAG: hypothetical protein KAR13_18820, partial [Desulfobulbaceae bacterium]|nr:hypothetical protein [Desulfobulbaceae bacterium]